MFYLLIYEFKFISELFSYLTPQTIVFIATRCVFQNNFVVFGTILESDSV